MKVIIAFVGILAVCVGNAADETTRVLRTGEDKGVKYVELAELPVACQGFEVVPGEAVSLLPKDKKFRLVWNDEFNGDRLDDSKWGYRTNFWGRPAHWFAKPGDGCVTVNGGVVRLKIKKLSDGQFVSPQLQTGELMWDVPHNEQATGFWPLVKREPARFLKAFGYFECRCKLQQMPGWWSAFWMQAEGQGSTLNPRYSGIEHDIMESFDPDEILPACFHYNGYGPDYRGFRIPDVKRNEDSILKVDRSQFHTFGMLWTPEGYSVYVDGRLRGTNNQAVSQVPEFILLSTECKWYRNNRMTGKGVPELESAVSADDSFVVDYVRVFDVVE